MFKDLPSEQRGGDEMEPVAQLEPRVYPMGFIPTIKDRLVDFAQNTLGERNIQLTALGTNLVKAIQNVDKGENLQEVFELAQQVKDFAEKGGKVSNEEIEFVNSALRTEEELAVIFAKVSRSAGSFEDIAKTVTEEGARKFHEKWTTSLEGYGHASVAEHAIVHLAVENVPSLDGDIVTDNRPASYTEFSARFKGRQDLGYFTPDSVLKDHNLSRKWHDVHKDLFEVHDSLVAKGLVYVTTDEAQEKHSGRKVFTADGAVKTKVVADQFKNLMPASRLTSIAVTANAREVENMIRKMSSDPHPSVQKLGGMFKEASLQVAPTLVKYAEKNEYLTLTKEGIGKIAESSRFQGDYPEISEEGKLVELVDYDHLSEEKFIAAALFQESNTSSFVDTLKSVIDMSQEEKRNVINTLLGNLGRHDVPIRSLEFSGNYLVEYPGMTYGDWREYKRHRMQTYAAKDLDVRWGYMTPPLAQEMDESQDSRFNGSTESIRRVMGRVDELFNEVSKTDPQAAQYCVTRLHYRPAIAMFNTREAFHLINLRTGPTAHPFIRRLIWPLYDEIKNVHPILMDHLNIKMESGGRPGRDFPWTV